MKESDLIREGASDSVISLDFEGFGRNQNIEIRFHGNKKKELLINGIPSAPGKLYGIFPVVLFVPAHLEIVSGAPEERRKFLDMALCREKPKTIGIINSYKKILDQRNRVLKDSARYSGLDGILDVWDTKLAQYGSELSKRRSEICRSLSEYASEIYGELSAGEKLEIVFEPGGGTGFEEAYHLLKKNFKDDIRLGYTNTGAHRDDIKITVNGRDGRRFASQGQQRSAVIAMKLAESRLLREHKGEPPVLLLDDVLSELDSGRRNFLLNNIHDMQRIVTSCDGGNTGECSVYEVKDGTFTAQ